MAVRNDLQVHKDYDVDALELDERQPGLSEADVVSLTCFPVS